MKNFSFSLAAVFIYFFCWNQITAAAVSQEWFLCSKADDCTKVQNSCGRPVGVNKKFRELYEIDVAKEWKKNPNPCLAPNEANKDLFEKAIAQCTEQKCTVYQGDKAHQ